MHIHKIYFLKNVGILRNTTVPLRLTQGFDKGYALKITCR